MSVSFGGVSEQEKEHFDLGETKISGNSHENNSELMLGVTPLFEELEWVGGGLSWVNMCLPLKAKARGMNRYNKGGQMELSKFSISKRSSYFDLSRSDTTISCLGILNGYIYKRMHA